jgi:aldehyde dehydrogenase (NAD+)
MQDVMDPSTGSPLAKVAMGGPKEIDDAVAAAWKAFPSWAATPPVERAVLLHRLADKLQKQMADMVLIESLDVGKAIVNTEGFDIPTGIECIRYFADLAVQTQYSTPLAIKNIEARTYSSPYGVCGFIFPWNFPFDLLCWGIIPALAAGNTVVIKPSEITPLSTLFFTRIAQEVGFPDGVINVVVGDVAAGKALANHQRIKRMAFTGSPVAGKLVGEACGRNLVPCKLELGGKGAAVVFDDVNLDTTAAALAGAITFNTGQVCCTASRWIFHEKIHDELVAKISSLLRQTKIGPALDRQTQMGPLASKAHMERVQGYLQKGKSQGAEFLLTGEAVRVEGFERGYYLSHSLLTGSPDNICYREEVFGPTAFILKFKDEDAAIKQVNSLDYGLANSVWSGDLKRAGRVAERMIAGNSWINAHNVFAYGLPYRAANLSGLGGGVNSPETFHDYLRPQTIARPLA